MKSFFVKNGKLKDGKEVAHETDERKPTSARRWTDVGLVFPSARQIRRIKDRNTDRETKRFRRQQLQQWHIGKSYREIAAVKVLRHLETVGNLGEGGLRLQLIEDGKLSPTRIRIHGHTEDMEPITSVVPRAHTPREILGAAGIDDNKLAELYSDLVEDEQQAAELRRAEKRQAAQAKREAAVTA